MGKFIWFGLLIAFWQCKSQNNDLLGTLDNSSDIVSVSDTLIKEIKKVYRGDTLITYLTMVGDTIIEKSTSKYGINKAGDIIEGDYHTRPRTSKAMPSETGYDELTPSPMKAAEDVSSSRIRPESPESPQAGLVTAGEWNDLNNWEDWTSLLNENDYSSMQNVWGIYPTGRYSVFITNEENTPLSDIKISLRSGQKILWSSHTDNTGRAELWSYLFNIENRAKSKPSVLVENKGDSYSFTPHIGKTTHFKIKTECVSHKNVDVMFVVDATGSMGDEINYLKSEVKDVIQQTMKKNDDLDMRIGSVFYRDINDQYLTTVSPLSYNLDRVYEFINDQSARGGGDYPEAVDAALEEALGQEWSENAVARIIFLLLDAPPHQTTDVESTIRDQIKEAAERGIKIIPISASGINRETEFLLKFMSIATNGTYVFITDDSGIGNPHLDPLVDNFEIEKLNDLLTRLISNYSNSNRCEPLYTINEKVNIYPNPTSNYINIESEFAFDQIRVVSNSGKIVLVANRHDGISKIDLTQLAAGVYAVQCIASDYQYSQNIIVVNG